MSPRDLVIKRFDSRVLMLLRHHRELRLAIHNKRNETTLANELVTQFTLQVSVLWQSFLSDLMLAYIQMRPRKAMALLQERIQQSLLTKFGRDVSRCTQFDRPGKVTPQRVRSLLDPKGWNIAFQNAASLSKKANEWLAGQYARRFALNSGDSELFDYVVCLRNFLSHYSVGARSALKAAIDGMREVSHVPLKARFINIGSYLNGGESELNGETRAEYTVLRLLEIAQTL